MMNKVLTIMATIAIAATALTETALADGAKPINERRSAKPDENVSINNIAGSVVVVGTGESEIVVTGTIAERLKLEIKQSPEGQTLIRVVHEEESSKQWKGRGDADLQIKLPRGSKVEISTISADITASNITGRVALQSVSGEISTGENVEKLHVKSVSGDVAIGHSTTMLEAETVSGTVTVKQAKNLVNAQTVSGDVVVNGSNLSQLLLRSVSGEIHFEGSVSSDAKVRINNHSGDVTLSVPASTSAEFELISRSGSIRNTLTSDRGKELFMGGREAEFKTGSGTASIKVESFSGTITVRHD